MPSTMNPEAREAYHRTHGFYPEQIPEGLPSARNEPDSNDDGGPAAEEPRSVSSPASPDDEAFEFLVDAAASEPSILSDEPDEEAELPSDIRKATKKQLAERLRLAEEQSNLTQSLAEAVRSLREPAGAERQPAPEAPRDPEPAPEPDVTYDDITDPSRGVDSVKRLVGSQVRPALSTLLNLFQDTQRQLLQVNPKTSEFANEHLQEIDAEFARMSPQERLDKAAYNRAYARVRERHSDEILEAEVKKRVAAELEKIGGANGASSSRGDITETGDAQPPARGGERRVRRVVLTPAMQREQLLKGMGDKEYFNYLRNSGRIK